MPPSNFGARPSIATAWHSRGSPIGCAPASSTMRRIVPLLYGVPRTMKLRAASPQASRSQSRFASKPPEASTTASAVTLLRLAAHAHGRGAERAAAQIETRRPRRRTARDAEPLRGGIVAVHERRAAAQEERVGARQVQRAAQRRLKARAERLHPSGALAGAIDHEACELLVRLAVVDAQQVDHELLFGIALRSARRSARRERSADCACAGCCRRESAVARTRPRRRGRRLGARSAPRSSPRCRRRARQRRSRASSHPPQVRCSVVRQSGQSWHKSLSRRGVRRVGNRRRRYGRFAMRRTVTTRMSHGPRSTAKATASNPADSGRVTNTEIAFADCHGAAKLLLGERPEHESEHGGHERESRARAWRDRRRRPRRECPRRASTGSSYRHRARPAPARRRTAAAAAASMTRAQTPRERQIQHEQHRRCRCRGSRSASRRDRAATKTAAAPAAARTAGTPRAARPRWRMTASRASAAARARPRPRRCSRPRARPRLRSRRGRILRGACIGVSRRGRRGTSESRSRPSATRRAEILSPCRVAMAFHERRQSSRLMPVNDVSFTACDSSRPCLHAWYSVSPTANKPDHEDHDVDAVEKLRDTEREARAAGQRIDADEAEREAEKQAEQPAHQRRAEQRGHRTERDASRARKYSAGPNRNATEASARREQRQAERRQSARDKRSDRRRGRARRRRALDAPSGGRRSRWRSTPVSPGVFSRMLVVEPPYIAP